MLQTSTRLKYAEEPLSQQKEVDSDRLKKPAGHLNNMKIQINNTYDVNTHCTVLYGK